MSVRGLDPAKVDFESLGFLESLSSLLLKAYFDFIQSHTYFRQCVAKHCLLKVERGTLGRPSSLRRNVDYGARVNMIHCKISLPSSLPQLDINGFVKLDLSLRSRERERREGWNTCFQTL